MRAFRILKTALWKFYADDGPFMARGLAFGLLIYCIPLSLLTISGLSYTLVGSTNGLVWIRRIFQLLMPQFTDEFSTYLTSIVDRRGLLGLTGFVAFLFVSSTTFGSLRLVLNNVFQVQDRRGILHGKMMELVMMIATSTIVFVMIVSVNAMALAQSVFFSLAFTQSVAGNLQATFPWLARYVHPGAIVVSGAASFAATAAMFWFLYRFSPAKTLRTPSLFVGALAATVLFELSKFAFAWYVQSMSGTTALYGALSGLVFFFLWVYYGCVVFVIGAEVGWAFEHK